MNEKGCGRVRGRLERYVDGTLSPLEEALDRGHLEACGACRVEEARWRELVTSVARTLRPSAEDLSEALVGLDRRLDALSPVRRRWSPARAPVVLSLATAAAALFLLLVLQWSGRGLDPAARVSTRELVPDIRLRLPALSEVVGELWRPEELR